MKSNFGEVIMRGKVSNTIVKRKTDVQTSRAIKSLEKQKLSKAVQEFAREMEKRLHRKVNIGYIGWDRPDKFSDEGLIHDLRMDAIEFPIQVAVDIANRAMFLWWRHRHET